MNEPPAARSRQVAIAINGRFRQAVRLSHLLFLADLASIGVAWMLALWVRFEGAVPPWAATLSWTLLPPVVLIHAVSYASLGFYRRLWQYADARDLVRLAIGQAVATVGSWLVIYQGYQAGYPRSAVVLSGLLALFFVGGTRALVKLGATGLPRRRGKMGNRVLVVGAGEAGRLVARELGRHPELGAVAIGFADDDPRKQGMVVGGLPVLADRTRLSEVVASRQIDQIIIAIPSASRQAISEWVRLSVRTPARLMVLPGMFELLNSQVDLARLREARPEDLLGRDPAAIDLDQAAAYLRDRVVLVTGAGGSIGSELCRQIGRFGPRKLVLLGNEENQLHELAADLDLDCPDCPRQTVLADIRDQTRISRVLQHHRPDLVFHAAAHKHVPLLENDPEEAVKNNLFGTRNVALAALAAGVADFVYVSSDKAVRPASVMGASKRVGELIIQSLNREGNTVFVAVRFGNVLGSRGSVLPIFQRQVARGGPVTVTDPAATRYFMTVDEACQLLIQAAAMGRGGQVLVLDMGTPVRILDLAENVIRLAGKQPHVDIPIRFVGLRQGEKVHEELLTAGEEVGATAHDRIFVAQQEASPWPVLEGELQLLAEYVRDHDEPALRQALFRLAGGRDAGGER
ncbi:MAG TPA: nucleoside-diphosphate sugar epimerase/dehydratase [Bacillota bacterium]|nr:nucleoside-diphosphate sugar epimerase/dehydratase [Bacillota bacterium]